MSFVTEDRSLMSRTAIVSFSSGIVFIIVTLVAVALLNLPKSAGAAVVDGANGPCPVVEVILDQGYGIGRTALEPVCRDPAGQADAPKIEAR